MVTSEYCSIIQLDKLSIWILNGEAQNKGLNPIDNVIVIWHLYDASENIVNL